jgi:DnaJ-class molecular chaperone
MALRITPDSGVTEDTCERCLGFGALKDELYCPACHGLGSVVREKPRPRAINHPNDTPVWMRRERKEKRHGKERKAKGRSSHATRVR